MANTTSTDAVRSKAPLWASLTATFFNIGYGKPGPGTWASVATVLLWYGLARYASTADRLIAAIGDKQQVVAGAQRHAIHRRTSRIRAEPARDNR